MFAPERSLNPESFASKLKTRQKVNGLVQSSAPRDVTTVQVAGLRTANETTITSRGVQSTAGISRNAETAGTVEVVLATSGVGKERLTRKSRHRPLPEQRHLAGRSPRNLRISSPKSTIPSLEGPWNGTGERRRASTIRNLASSSASKKGDARSKYARWASARLTSGTSQDGASLSHRNSHDVFRSTRCFLCETDLRSATKHQCVECPQIIVCSVCLPNASHIHPNHQFHCLPASGSDSGGQNPKSESAKASSLKSKTRDDLRHKSILATVSRPLVPKDVSVAQQPTDVISDDTHTETLPGASVVMRNAPTVHIDRELPTYRCDWCKRRLVDWRYECQQCHGHVSFCAKHQNNHYSLHTIKAVALNAETISNSEAIDTIRDVTNLADSLPKEQELSAVTDGSSLHPFVSSTDASCGTRQDGVISLGDEGLTYQGRDRSSDECSPSFGSEGDGSPAGEFSREAEPAADDIERANESGIESVLSAFADSCRNCASDTDEDQPIPRSVQYDDLLLSVCTSVIDSITNSTKVPLDQDVRQEAEMAASKALHRALYGSADIKPLCQLVIVRTARERRSLLDFDIDLKTHRTNSITNRRRNGPRQLWLPKEQHLLKRLKRSKRKGFSEKEIGLKLKRSAAAIAQQ